MLEIIVIKNDIRYKLDLYDNTKIKIKIVSPFWDFDNFRGSYSLPVRIPQTTNNKRILDFANWQDIAEHKYDCVLRVNGIDRYTGTLNITDITEEEYEINMSLSLQRYKDKLYQKMNEVDIYGGDKPLNLLNISFDRINNGTEIIETEIAMPEIAFFKFWKESLNSKLSYYPITANKRSGDNILLYYQDINSKVEEMDFMVPSVKVKKVLEYIANWLNVKLKADIMYNELNWLQTLTPKALYNTEYDETTNTWLIKEVSTYNIKNHLPSASFVKFFKALRNYFALGIEFNSDEIKITPLKDIIANEEYEEWTNSVTKKTNKKGQTYENIKFTWDYDKNDDEYYDIGIENYNILYRTFPSDATDNDLVLMDDCGEELVKRGVRLFRKKYIPPDWDDIEITGWIDISQAERGYITALAMAQPYSTGKENVLEINLNASPIFAAQYVGNLQATPYCTTGAYGISKDTKTGYNDKIRFLFSRVIDGKTRATHYDKEKGIALDFFSQCSVRKKFWDPVWEVLKNAKYETEVYVVLPAKKLYNIDPKRKIKIGNKQYLFKEIEFTIDTYGQTSEAKALLLPLD